MEKDALKKKVAKFPQEPGVYFFAGKGGNILYVGKATSLRDRVRSYFGKDLIDTRGPLLVQMVSEAEDVSFERTESALEALILEANWIRKAKPRFNTMAKDDKTYNYVVITKEDYPQVFTVRERELEMAEAAGGLPYKVKRMFGPYPFGGQLKEAMKIMRRIFPYRDQKCRPGQGRPCFNRQLGLCPGVCTGEASKEEYADTIGNLTLFFDGKKRSLVKSLEKEMKDAAKRQDFEAAARARNTVFALTHIRDVSLIKEEPRPKGSSTRIEAYDVAHISGTSVVGVMTVVENGEAKKSNYRKFRIRVNPGVNDTGALTEILSRRLNHLEWGSPDLVVVDGGTAQMNAAEAVFRERGIDAALVSVLKDERHKPKDILGDRKAAAKHGKEILLANSEAHRFAITYHRLLRERFKRR